MRRFIIITSNQIASEKLPDISISFAEVVPNHLNAIAKLPHFHICIVDTLLNKSYYL